MAEAPGPSRAEIRKAVARCTRERILSELTQYQTALSIEYIESLSKQSLITQLTELRFTARQVQPLPQVVSDFVPVTVNPDDPSDAYEADPLTERTDLKETAQTTVTNPTDSCMQMLIQQQMAFQKLMLEKEETMHKLMLEKEEKAREQQIALQQQTLAIQKLMLDNQKAAQDRADADRALLQQQQSTHQTFATRVEKFSKITKILLSPFPHTAEEVPSWFADVEKIWSTNGVDADVQTTLLTPFLSQKVRQMMRLWTAQECASYELLRDRILREFEVSASVHQKNFETARRLPGESSANFVSRLGVLLANYLKARAVSSYDQLKDMLILDKFRNSLAPNLKYLIAEKEIHEKLSPDTASRLIDLWEAQARPNYNTESFNSFRRNDNWKRKGDNGSSQAQNGQDLGQSSQNNTPFPNLQHAGWGPQNKFGETNAGFNRRPFQTQNRSSLRCEACQGIGHLKQECRKKNETKPHGPPKVRMITRGRGGRGGRNRGGTRVRAVTQVQETQNDAATTDDTATQTKEVRRVAQLPADVDCDVTSTDSKHDVLRVTAPPTERPQLLVIFGLGKNQTPVNCIVDSGADISCAHPDMLGGAPLEGSTPIQLQSAFREKVSAVMGNISARIVCNTAAPVTLTIAATSHLQENTALLTPSDFELLQSVQYTNPTAEYLTNTPYLYTDQTLTEEQNKCRRADIKAVATCDRGNVKLTPEEERQHLHTDVMNDNTTPTEFLAMQKSDESLQSYFKEADKPNTAFFTDKGFLFRRGSSGSVAVNQLVIPQEKRAQLVRHAHDSLFSMHFSKRRTTLRLQAYVWWPGMAAQVEKHVALCSPCCKHATKSRFDRTPIAAIPLASELFQEVQIDIFGPINPPSARNHKYILTLVCAATKWVEALPLKTICAKEVIDAMLQMFMKFRVPYYLGVDNGSQFTSNLAEEVFKRLGITVHFSTPHHYNSHGLVESWNKTLGRMLHHVLNSDDPRSWDLKLPFLLFAYRELPNSTTNMAPVTLAHGFAPNGPLSILRDTWSDREHVPVNLDRSSLDYLDKLRTELKTMHEIAVNNAEKQQSIYTEQYNKQTRVKTFDVNDKVLVLAPDSSNKLKSRWMSGTVVKAVDNCSYSVATTDGAVRVVHASMLRPFLANVAAVGVMFDQDSDFGPVLYDPTLDTESDFNEKLQQLNLSHLSVTEKHKLLQLLRKHQAVFSDRPGYCTVYEAALPLKPDFEFVMPRPYRLPEKVRSEIQSQVAQLLAEGRIVHSNSTFVHPVVAVAKPNNNGIRLAIDYRAANCGLLPDRYPVPRCQDLVQDFASCKILSLCDCSQAFWSIPLRKQDRYKTAFVVEGVQYEWCFLSFGLANASSQFQQAMDIALRPVSSHSRAFIDDVITGTRQNDFDLHILQLDQMLSAMQVAGFNLKLSKCKWALPHVPFIGFEIGQNVIKPLHDKLEAIRNAPVPTTKKALRSWLGLANFYRIFSACFSEITWCLTELTKKSVSARITLNAEQLEAFNALKAELCKATELYVPNTDKPFQLYVDSSIHSAGGALAQFDDNNVLRPVAFVSKKFDKTQANWPIIEKEAWALLLALQTFEHITFGCPLVICYTDHQPLLFMSQKPAPSPKLLRWINTLSRFSYTLKRVTGETNYAADWLSRYAH